MAGFSDQGRRKSMNKMMTGLSVALVLLVAFAGIARADGTMTNGAVLDSLNQAHKKLDSGDKTGAKKDLSALAAKLKGSTDAQHKNWRRKVQYIVIKLTVGLSSSAESSLHELIKEVSSASTPTPPAPPS